MPRKKQRKPMPFIEESNQWDELPLESLMERSRPLNVRFIDNRKPKRAISMRVDEDLITIGKRIASQWGLGYQTLFRLWLLEGVSRYCERQGVLDHEEQSVEEDQVAGALPAR